MREYSIAVIGGDGIGPEVIGETVKTVERAGEKFGFSVKWNRFPYGAAHYLKTGEVMPESALEKMAENDALLLGAVGSPEVKPGILEHGILLKLRFRFDQYVNLRPALSFPKVPTPVPLPGGKRLDTVVVRENTEDLYMGIGAVAERGALDMPIETERGSYSLKGSLKLDMSREIPFAAQVAVNSRAGVERIARYACKLALKRGEDRVTVVSKSNAVSALYGFFEDVVKGVMSDEFPSLNYEMRNVDALCYHLVRDPAAYGVLLCPNLFGDIVSDLQAGLAGGLGTAAGGNIGDGLSMFEPVHGSAPDIAGSGKANPIAAILSGALMLRHVGEDEAANAVERAVSDYLDGAECAELPYEFGGNAHFSEVGDSVASKI